MIAKMARKMMMARAVVSILITIVLLLAFFTGLEGEEDEGGGFGGGEEGGGHTMWAYVLVLLFLLHLVLNYRTFIVEMRSFFRKGEKDKT